MVLEWKKTCENLKAWGEIVIKHYFIYDLSDPIKEIHLHGISDASQSAYAAYIYLKSETQCENFAVKVVTTKSRVWLKSCLLSIFNLKIFYVGVIHKFH